MWVEVESSFKITYKEEHLLFENRIVNEILIMFIIKFTLFMGVKNGFNIGLWDVNN